MPGPTKRRCRQCGARAGFGDCCARCVCVASASSCIRCAFWNSQLLCPTTHRPRRSQTHTRRRLDWQSIAPRRWSSRPHKNVRVPKLRGPPPRIERVVAQNLHTLALGNARSAGSMQAIGSALPSLARPPASRDVIQSARVRRQMPPNVAPEGGVRPADRGCIGRR